MINDLKILIVEDELRGRNALKALLKSIPGNILVGEAPDVDTAKKLIEETQPDLILLDIEMPYKNGFDLLTEVPNRNFEVIFTTAYDSYAIKAIKFSALDYLLKPINPEELQAAIEKTTIKRNEENSESQEKIKNLLENLRVLNKQNFKLSLPTTDGMLFVPIVEIVKLEAEGSYAKIYFSNGKRPTLVSRSLKEYNEILENYGFCRIHNSTLINLKFVKQYIRGDGGKIIMVDGTSVEISRRKRESFQIALEKFSNFL